MYPLALPAYVIDFRSVLGRNGYRLRPLAEYVEQGRVIIVTHQSLGSTKALPPGQLTKNILPTHIANGWPGFAYHFAIEPSGAIFCCNDVDKVTYHSGGEANRLGIGILVHANARATTADGRVIYQGTDALPLSEANEHQRQAWMRLVGFLLDELDLRPDRALFGHCDAPGGTHKAACPGDAIMGWIETFRHPKLSTTAENR